ncbi:MAG TPA: site-2 protease family protein [Polyangia bacterium]|nr:site-2 protease family protein [Polyangia bacterium]
MFPSFRIGSLFGFPVRVHLSFILLLGMVVLFMGGLTGLAVVLMVAGSVLLHELGHALVARHLNVRVSEIGLHFFGGAARLAGLPRRPGDEIAIAAAGPAVSFMLAGMGHGLAAVTRVPVFALFGWVNLVLGAFNLLPVFPSDGGRILRALLARRRGLVRATEIAVTVGRVACVALIVAGLYVGSVQMVFVAVALWTFGTAERLAVRSRGDHGAWSGEGASPLVHAEYLPPAEIRRESFPRRAEFVWRR